MKNNIEVKYKTVCAERLCDYLLFVPSNKIRDEYQYHKFRILSDEFLTSFKRLISDEELFMTYSSSACYNAIVLAQEIDFSLGCEDFTKLIYSKGYNRYRFTCEKYYYEYAIKQLSLNSEFMNNAYVLSEDSLCESLKCDYDFLIMLDSSSVNYISLPYTNLLLDKNIIYSINKLLKDNRDLLKYKDIKKRINTILNINLKLISNIDEEVRDLYEEKNNKKLDLKEVEVFSELNLNAINMINNPKIKPFNIDSIKLYYDFLKIENYLNSEHLDKKNDISKILLDNIYYYIDNVDSITLKNKLKLISLLNKKKDNINDYELNVLKDYIKKVDLKETLIDNDRYEFEMRSNIFTYVKAKAALLKGDNSLYKKIISAEEKDLYVFELLIMDDEYFNKNIMYFNTLSFEYSIKKFMMESIM